MQGLSESTRLRLLLLLMGVLQAAFLALRLRPYGPEKHGLLALTLTLTATATLLAMFLPERFADRATRWQDAALATRGRALLVVLVVALVAGIAGVLTQQVFSWDERAVLWSAEVVADGGPSALFARYGESVWLGPQHPPLVPLLYGAVTSVVGSHLKVLRLVDLAFGCGTVLVAFLIAERLYERRTALLASMLLLASPLFQRIATAATNDMPLTFLFSAAILLALRLERRGEDRIAVALGLIVGCGLLVKYTMLLVFPVLLALPWCTGKPAVVRRHGAVVLVIASALLLVWLDHAWSLGILDTQQQRLGRLAGMAQRYPFWALDSLVFKAPSAIGVFILPWIALGAVAMFHRRALQDRFVGCWIVLVFVPLLLTLPDNRYFLPAFPALAIVGGQALAARPRWSARVVLLALLLCAITLVFYTQIDLAMRAGVFSRPTR
jgi:4-amino-4-deoxy-L-arabinose transferase-like glycosyltransferase